MCTTKVADVQICVLHTESDRIVVFTTARSRPCRNPDGHSTPRGWPAGPGVEALRKAPIQRCVTSAHWTSICDRATSLYHPLSTWPRRRLPSLSSVAAGRRHPRSPLGASLARCWLTQGRLQQVSDPSTALLRSSPGHMDEQSEVGARTSPVDQSPPDGAIADELAPASVRFAVAELELPESPRGGAELELPNSSMGDVEMMKPLNRTATQRIRFNDTRWDAVAWWSLQLLAALVAVVPPLVTEQWLAIVLPVPVVVAVLMPVLLIVRTCSVRRKLASKRAKDNGSEPQQPSLGRLKSPEAPQGEGAGSASPVPHGLGHLMQNSKDALHNLTAMVPSIVHELTGNDEPTLDDVRSPNEPALVALDDPAQPDHPPQRRSFLSHRRMREKAFKHRWSKEGSEEALAAAAPAAASVDPESSAASVSAPWSQRLQSLQSIDDSIYVVVVSRLREALGTRAPREVLLELFDGGAISPLLQQVEATVARRRGGFALISYRQERLSPDDGTTCDAAVLADIVSVAGEARTFHDFPDRTRPHTTAHDRTRPFADARPPTTFR